MSITCSNCNHINPDGAIQCEACYTPLEQNKNCPQCGTSVQPDATFCGQCGYHLKGEVTQEAIPETVYTTPPAGIPEISLQQQSEEIPETIQSIPPSGSINSSVSEATVAIAENTPVYPETSSVEKQANIQPEVSKPITEPLVVTENEEVPTAEIESEPVTPNNPVVSSSPVELSEPVAAKPQVPTNATQLQITGAKLFHVQTNTEIELPQNVSIIHIGKPNNQIPPDIDVSGFPNSEVVSRIHADIRVEGDNFYIEDVGSSNGTYINHTPLPTGDRHKLRSGDRIGLGKGDKVTFIFQQG
ncbi:MAG: FHA domain-containing protein [Cyanobacteria bacterium J083]|nr:MAG: FHA domain-containing protein [Cyanobacteria bacterium J083]